MPCFLCFAFSPLYLSFPFVGYIVSAKRGCASEVNAAVTTTKNIRYPGSTISLSTCTGDFCNGAPLIGLQCRKYCSMRPDGPYKYIRLKECLTVKKN